MGHGNGAFEREIAFISYKHEWNYEEGGNLI